MAVDKVGSQCTFSSTAPFFGLGRQWVQRDVFQVVPWEGIDRLMDGARKTWAVRYSEVEILVLQGHAIASSSLLPSRSHHVLCSSIEENWSLGCFIQYGDDNAHKMHDLEPFLTAAFLRFSRLDKRTAPPSKCLLQNSDDLFTYLSLFRTSISFHRLFIRLNITDHTAQIRWGVLNGRQYGYTENKTRVNPYYILEWLPKIASWLPKWLSQAVSQAYIFSQGLVSYYFLSIHLVD